MKRIEAILTLSKDTKGTHVFKTEDPNCPVSTLYVSKGDGGAFADGKVPKTIRIVIDAIEQGASTP